LGYFSEFFDAACYGEFIEAKKHLIEMPEETEEQMETIIGWMYTGQLESTLEAGGVWAVADKLQIPGLANEAMYFLFDYYREIRIDAMNAKFAYENTGEGSRLRNFVRDLIIVDGPLSAAVDEGVTEPASEFREEWHSLIKDGGELVLDIAKAGSSFSNHVKPGDKSCPIITIITTSISFPPQPDRLRTSWRARRELALENERVLKLARSDYGAS
jgi:hypothetical protein